jgi:hypothetical protein
VSFSDLREDPGCDQGAVTSWAWELGDRGLSHSTSQQVTIEDGSSGGCATGGMGGSGGWLMLVLVLWGNASRSRTASRHTRALHRVAG